MVIIPDENLQSRLANLHAQFYSIFFSNDPPTTHIYTPSLHDALPIFMNMSWTNASPRPAGITARIGVPSSGAWLAPARRSEEHTSELQSHSDLVCRLLLEKKKKL